MDPIYDVAFAVMTSESCSLASFINKPGDLADLASSKKPSLESYAVQGVHNCGVLEWFSGAISYQIRPVSAF
jgi:hypothetical protein